MKIGLISKVENGEEIKINEKGYEEIEVDLFDISNISDTKANRFIGLGKQGLFRLAKQSWIDLHKKGIITRTNFGLSK